MESDGFYTENMTLVAFLITRRIRHTMMERRGNQVVWRYTRDIALEECITSFEQRRGRVEPVAFHRALTKVRREMNSLLTQ